MRNINWVTALFLVLTPVIGVIWGVLYIPAFGIHPIEVALFFLCLTATGFSITAGYHRHFAHGAFQCRRFVQVLFLIFGAAAFQQSVLSWSSDHRRHHKNIDDDGDPYNIRRGFFWAHVGWLLFKEEPPSEDFSNVPDLLADPLVRVQHQFYVPLALLMGFGLPFALGTGMGHPWGCLLWAGFFRIVIVHHSTFLVNSLAHTLGKQPYTLAVSARDSVVTALLTFGEGYHNFHHRFSTDYRNGVFRYQWDPTKWLIRTMAALGWAYDLSRVPREKIVAAELQCDVQRLLERWKGRSERTMAAARERIRELASLVERSAARLESLERELARGKETWGAERRRQLLRLRIEIRAARREFKESRKRWRRIFAELYASPAPQAA